jgi:hypothetical protein
MYILRLNRAYKYFEIASELNHTKSLEYVARGYLFGDYLDQNVTPAQEIQEDLSAPGSPRGQFVSQDGPVGKSG